LAIKAGQILHAMNTFIVDRIQTAGANLNIPTERVHELGNFQSVAVIRDIPDLSFDLDVLDVGTAIEGLLTQIDSDPHADAAGTQYDLLTNFPADIISPMKSAQGAFDIVKSVVVPHLTLESASYRYGLQENAGEQYTLQGDAIFYVPGNAITIFHEGDGSETSFDFEDPDDPLETLTALPYLEGGVTFYALNVSVDGQRMSRGFDYTDTATGIEFNDAPENEAAIRIIIGVSVTEKALTFGQNVHRDISIKPAAIRGKDIDVFIGEQNGDPWRWGGIQSVNLDWRVDLEDDFEFGQSRAVNRDATDAPEVTGQIELRPRNPRDFFDRLRAITGVDQDEVIGPQSSVVVPLEIQLKNPESGGAASMQPGDVVKTLYVPDARFTIPGYEGRVQTKSDPTLEFESDTGLLEVFKGARPA
jgi:hypothetical protein